MKTREEPFERQCPYCDKGMRERPAKNWISDDYIVRTFECQACGGYVHVSCPRPVYKPLEELKAKRGEIALKLNALEDEFCKLSDLTMVPTKEVDIVGERIIKLHKELNKINKKINKVRRERNENE